MNEVRSRNRWNDKVIGKYGVVHEMHYSRHYEPCAGIRGAAAYFPVRHLDGVITTSTGKYVNYRE